MNKENKVGNKIKQLRKSMGLTQEQLAEKIDMDSKHLSKIENGLHLPTYKTLAKLAEFLKLDIEEIENAALNKNEELNPAYLKSLKILNSAKNNNELMYYFEVLKLAQKGMRLK